MSLNESSSPRSEPAPDFKIVTQAQLDKGYLVNEGYVFYRCRYLVLKDLEDGTFLVAKTAPRC